MPPQSDLIERLWSKVDVGAADECWPWTAGRYRDGYGRIAARAASCCAHRVMWEIANRREIPAGLIVRHTCDNPPCCNPAHLTLGTQADNIRDSVERRRHACATKTHCKHGHPFDEANTYTYRGYRTCRICRRESCRRRDAIRRFRRVMARGL